MRQPCAGEQDPRGSRGDDTVNNDGEYLEHTRQFWQSRTSRQLSREDARQISANMTGFFQVLLEWDAAEHADAHSQNQDTASEPCKQNGGVQAGQRIRPKGVTECKA